MTAPRTSARDKGAKAAAPTQAELETAYIDQRRAENRGDCTSCGEPDEVCTRQVLGGAGTACCAQCRVNDTHPRPPHEGKHYSTQATFHCTPTEARKMAIDLLRAAEECKRPNQYVKIHSFGKGASAWSVENVIISEM
jgi:hypothetical protein